MRRKVYRSPHRYIMEITAVLMMTVYVFLTPWLFTPEHKKTAPPYQPKYCFYDREWGDMHYSIFAPCAFTQAGWGISI